uniref:Uncharacterized protein n=1 Tax=viral metagenome TaxID=1070528 RepID=A0A6C0F606_9ZZZZ
MYVPSDNIIIGRVEVFIILTAVLPVIHVLRLDAPSPHATRDPSLFNAIKHA